MTAARIIAAVPLFVAIALLGVIAAGLWVIAFLCGPKRDTDPF